MCTLHSAEANHRKAEPAHRKSKTQHKHKPNWFDDITGLPFIRPQPAGALAKKAKHKSLDETLEEVAPPPSPTVWLMSSASQSPSKLASKVSQGTKPWSQLGVPSSGAWRTTMVECTMCFYPTLSTPAFAAALGPASGRSPPETRGDMVWHTERPS